MPLSSGTTLGPYTVTAQIGAGGMGEVYRARDTKLDRDVALKVLPEAFTSDPDRLVRFEREAKVLASLNHPNIGHIYGLEEAEGTKALVLELVEGPTLVDRIAEGPIPIDEALPIAKQIAEALEAAHEQGIIHRDLKPANVKVKADGTVKVLDFGLAKAFQPEARGASASESPTISLTAAATQMGMVIGTAAYMAPEQARGKPVDTRADVWAFGVLVYEMLTGLRPFGGDDVSQTLARVIDREPEWSVPDTVPPGLSGYLRRCLDKDPRQRIQAIGDVRLALDGAFEMAVGPRAEVVEAQTVPRRSPILVIVGTAALTALVAGAAGWSLRAPSAPMVSPARFSVGATAGEVIGLGPRDRQLAVSADGTFVVYVAIESESSQGQLYVRHLDQLEAVPLRGGERGGAPFISPDGEWVGFVPFGSNTVMRVSILGGPPVTIAEHNARLNGLTWGADDQIVFGTFGGLYRVPAGGGTPEPLTTPDASHSHSGPSAIPGADAVLFVDSDDAPLNGGQLAVLDLSTGATRRLGLAGFSPRYVPTGHLLYASEDGSVRAVTFDADALEVTGTPVPVLEDVTVRTGGGADFSVSENGRLAYFSGDGTSSRRTLIWADRDGGQEAVDVPERAYTYARLSPDGTRIALDIRDQENDIWVWDIGREALTRVTVDPGFNRGPEWTPDGARLAFTADSDGAETMHWQRADGAGVMEKIATEPEQFPTSFSPDMTQLLFGRPLSGPGDIGVMTLDGERHAEMLLETEFDEKNATFSPDGAWIAYESDASGRDEIYVRPFPDVDSARYPVSTEGGTRPLWSSAGRELFYYRQPDSIMVVAIDDEPDFRVGRPEVAVQGPYARPVRAGRHFDVTADGRRVLLLVDQPTSGEAVERKMTVVLNWFEELKERVPVP